MNGQLALSFVRRVGHREYVLRRACEESLRFRSDFYDWLKTNMHIWERFEIEADRVWDAGRRHYSARTIGEVLRHETVLTARNDGEWKLNDHRWPDMARLYMLLEPDRDGFFETRGRN